MSNLSNSTRREIANLVHPLGYTPPAEPTPEWLLGVLDKYRWVDEAARWMDYRVTKITATWMVTLSPAEPQPGLDPIKVGLDEMDQFIPVMDEK